MAQKKLNMHIIFTVRGYA